VLKQDEDANLKTISVLVVHLCFCHVVCVVLFAKQEFGLDFVCFGESKGITDMDVDGVLPMRKLLDSKDCSPHPEWIEKGKLS